jgi:hypothetical protein
MRTTVNLADDAFMVVKQVAARERISMGEAMSRLIRRGAAAPLPADANPQALRGRFALLPARDEVITPDHVRSLMEREGI